MNGPKEANISTEAPEMCPKLESSTDFIKEDKACYGDVNFSTISNSSPDAGTSCSKKDIMECEGYDYRPTASLGYNGTSSKLEEECFVSSQQGSSSELSEAPCLVSSKALLDGASSCTKKDIKGRVRFADQSCRYLPTTSLSCNGPNSKIEDPSFVSPREGSKAPCRAPHMGYGVQPTGHRNGYPHMANSSFPVQQQDVLRRPTVGRPRPFGQIGYTDRPRTNDYFNCQRNELIRGPRASRIKNSSSSPSDQISSNLLIRREQYNKSDFPITYKQAKFFMIKSYSEDDIHKSIKYNVWASTPYGNSKLDAAFKNAEMLMKENGTKCPIFLFFSVNASGQFVGMAEMVGPVDFKKSMDFWQQDKWNGFFPVTWHVIKDIPNRQFQNIILENNDNKAVPFSRDTQEIGLPQGLRMLFIFKGFPHGTSVLDDFEFYEDREKTLRATRSSRTASRTPGLEYDCESSSLNQLEAAFRNVNVSPRPRNPPDRRFSEAAFRDFNNVSPRPREAAFRDFNNVSPRPREAAFRDFNNVSPRPRNPPDRRSFVGYHHNSGSSMDYHHRANF